MLLNEIERIIKENSILIEFKILTNTYKKNIEKVIVITIEYNNKHILIMNI